LLYLLDANVLIDANRDYYPVSRVPEFWSWLRHTGEQGKAKIPEEIYEELVEGRDPLSDWLRDYKRHMLLSESVRPDLIDDVIRQGYAEDLTDEEITKMGRDPFLVAHALAFPGQRCVVTTEASKPKRTRANRHIPDVCRDLGVPSCNTFEFLRRLDFSTGWRGP